MDLQTTIISAATFIGGLITTHLIQSFFEKKKKVEESVDEAEVLKEQKRDSKIDHLELSVRNLELTLANLTGKLEMILPKLDSLGKIREDMAGFYAWKRDNQK